MSDSVIHFEIPADDLERAQDFYRDAFGWNINAMPDMGYTMVTTTEVNEQFRPVEPGAINGGMLSRQAPVDHPVITIGVDDIDAALDKVGSMGGSTVRGKEQVADMGYSAYFTDSEGNIVGLWQNA